MFGFVLQVENSCNLHEKTNSDPLSPCQKTNKLLKQTFDMVDNQCNYIRNLEYDRHLLELLLFTPLNYLFNKNYDYYK